MWLLSCVVAVVAIYVVHYLYKLRKLRQVYFSMPGEEGYSYITGTLHKFPGFNPEGLAYEHELAKRFKYFRVSWDGPVNPIVMFYHPDSIRELLKSHAPKPRFKLITSPYDMVVDWIGEGLISSNGNTWAQHRKLLTPAFHFNVLKPYVEIYNNCAETLVSQLESRCSETTSFDIYELVDLASLDVILQCAFSYKSGCQGKEGNEYASALQELQGMVLQRVLTPVHYIPFIYRRSAEGKRFYHLCDKVHKIADEVITRRRASIQNKDPEELEKTNKTKTTDFLDILLLARSDDGTGMSHLEIRSEVESFMFAGHDTTASGISWTLYSLGRHPEHQEKVYSEVCQVLGHRERLDWNDLAKLEYTTMCIKESLRLYGIVPFSGRTLEEDCVIDGHTIPAGTTVAIKIHTLHHHPDLWHEPMTFDPQRFHPDNQAKMDSFQFIPFSAGPRNCIGQNFAMNEMKVVISHVVKKYILSDDPDCIPQTIAGITTKSLNGIKVKAKPRTQ